MPVTSKKTNRSRDALGLPPLKPGITECLMCEQPFHSWDIRQNKRCPQCSQRLKKESETEPDEQYWDSLDTVVIELDDDYIDFINNCPSIIEKL